MGAIAALTAISVGTGLVTSNNEARAIKSQSAFEAQQLESNAAISDIYAKDAIKRGDDEAKRFRISTRQEVGDARAALAAQGYDLSEGTALDIQQDIVGFGAEDEETIKNNAWREAFGYKVQSTQQKTQAGFTRTTGKFGSKQAILTGFAKAGGDIAYGGYLSGRSASGTPVKKETIDPLGGGTL